MLRTFIALSLTLATTAAIAAEPADLIKYRQNTMKAIGGHMGAIAAIVQGKAGKPEHLALHAAGMEQASQTAADLFPADSAEGKTDAKAEIWNQPEDFQAAVERFTSAAAAFRQAADSGDMGQVGPALKELGGSCKNCHDNFRVKK